MQTSLKDQIEAVQHARKLLSGSIVAIPTDLIAKLNDAASTIAALNLTKDLPKDVFFNEQELRDIKMACDILGLMVRPKNEEQEKFFARCSEISDRLPHITYP